MLRSVVAVRLPSVEMIRASMSWSPVVGAAIARRSKRIQLAWNRRITVSPITIFRAIRWFT